MYDQRNSLLPNDAGLHGVGSNHSTDRRNSNESDESDNLSQYFHSTSSRKGSLMATNDISHTELPHEHNQTVNTGNNNSTMTASHRLQSFIKTSDENRQSRDSITDEPLNFKKTEERKSSIGLGSFKFPKKKKTSVDSPNQVCFKNDIIIYI